MISSSTTSKSWRRKSISDLFDIRAAGDIEWSRWNREQDSDHPYAVYANGRAESGLHGFASYATEKEGAITLTARGTLGELGYAFFRSAPFTPIGRLLVLRSKGEADARFFTSYINCVIRFAQENTSVAQLTVPQIARYQVDLPPICEQRAIATALSDVDALLAKLDQLIAKKRDLKQAAMQQLLTCQTRLPGFSGDWEVKRLGGLFSFSGGHTASRDQLSDSGYCYLHYGDIHLSQKTFIDLDAEFLEIPKLRVDLRAVSSSSLLKDGDVVFVDASEDDAGTSKHIVVINPNNIPYLSGLHTIVAKSKGLGIDNRFKRHCFQTRKIKEQFQFFAVGTKVSGISKTSIAKIELYFPPSRDEQTAIAAILSDMDTELAALEARRDKTRALKQGMMQVLLTGKILLI